VITFTGSVHAVVSVKFHRWTVSGEEEEAKAHRMECGIQGKDQEEVELKTTQLEISNDVTRLVLQLNGMTQIR
jgi:hypothetical protein